MGFLRVLFCCVESLIILSSSVHGQFPQNPFNPATNPVRNSPANSNIFDPLKGLEKFLDKLVSDITNPSKNPANSGPGNINNFNPPVNNPPTNPVNRGPGNINNFNPPANNPPTNPMNGGPGNFKNFNPLANNPFNQPSSFPSGFPQNNNGFPPNPFNQPMNPANQGPGNFNNFNPLANNPFNQPNNFPPRFPNNLGNFPPRGLPNNGNQPPFNNFNRPPSGPAFQSPVNQPAGISPFNPNANNPPNRPFNQLPANLNNFKPQPSLPQLPNNQPSTNQNNFKPQPSLPQLPNNQPLTNQNNFKPQPSSPQLPNNPPQHVIGQQPPLSGLPPSSPLPPAQNIGPSNHSSQPHAPPAHHIGPAFHPKANPPSPPPPPDDDPLLGHRLVCIYSNKHYFRNEFSPANMDPLLCTHVNYEFAILDPKTYEMISSEPELDIQMGFFEEAVKLKKSNKRLKVLISLGGWADSTEKYSILAADEELRKNFVEKAVQFIKKHEFDGMDLAWEYPNCWQGALGVSPKDKGNFVLLLKDLREAFNPENLVLSISVGAVQKEIKAAYDIPEVSKQVDFINVMTYDMHGPWEPKTGHHTQFEKLPGDKDPYWNSKGALAVWVEGGAPKFKLNMGIALYGKTFTLADPKKNGLNAPSTGVGNSNIDSVEGGFILYNTMCQWLNDGNWTEKEDKRAGFYAYAGDQWSCYDPPMMVVRKAKFIVEDGYGGLLFKDLGGDDYLGKCFSMPFPIVKMAKFEMLHRIHSKHHHG